MDAAAISMSTVSSMSSMLVCNSKSPKLSHVPSFKLSSPPIVRCINWQSSHLNSWFPLNSAARTGFACSAVTSSGDTLTSAAAAARVKVQILVEEFQSLTDPVDRVKRLLHYAELLPPFDDSMKIADNPVPRCTAQVWLRVEMDGGERMRFLAGSDSEITRGFCACLVWALDGATAEEVLAFKAEDFGALSVVGLNGYSSSRSKTWHNVLMSI